MRLLIISDIHSSNGAIDMVSGDIKEYYPDLLIICGDVTNFGPVSFADEFLDAIPTERLRTLAVPGNCDPPDVLAVLQKRGIDLHGKSVNIGGFDFVGFGGSNKTPFNTLMEFAEDYIFRTLDNIMVEGAVLVTHVPPRGHLDGSSDGQHFGSKAVTEIVRKYKSRAAISGHIHEARGVIREKDTVFLNPGPAMRGYRALMDLKGGEVEVELLG